MLIKNMTFQFQMSDCYKKKKGICPIQKNDTTVNCRCNEIREELEKENYIQRNNVPEIFHHIGCNHYSCNDGQHRICIAGKTGNDIEVKCGIAVNDYCTVCDPLISFGFASDCIEFLEDF